MKQTRKYQAFISYRHLPLDTKVAEKLQALIERYRIPKFLQKKHGKYLGLVFRDRTELPLSNDLTHDIYEALDHSEYLIVVCSRETPNSLWVNREIEYFINTHDRNHILTVLIDGEPEQSIPKEITTIRSSDGERILEQIEPLCAYLVAENEKKVLNNLKAEFLRLVAAMLDTPFDNLYQRHKRYKRKLLTCACAVIAVVIATIMFLLIQWNLDVTRKNKEISQKNEQIQEQLYQTQIKESESLTLLSLKYLAEHNRPAAIQAAVQALPSSSLPRPYYAAAEAALIQSLQPYSNEPYLIDYVINHTAPLRSMRITADGKYLATVDTFGALRCFDLISKQEMWTFSGYGEPAVLQYSFFYDFLFIDNALVFFTNNSVYTLSLPDGELLSSHDYLYTNLSIAQDGSGYTWVEQTGSDSDSDYTIKYRNIQEDQIHSMRICDEPIVYFGGRMSANGSSFLFIYASPMDPPQLFIALYDTATNTLQTIAQTHCDRYAQAKIVALPDNSYLLVTIPSSTNLVLTKFSDSGKVLTNSAFTCPEDLFLQGMRTCYSDGTLIATASVSDQTCLMLVDTEFCEVLKLSIDESFDSCIFSLQSDSHLVWQYTQNNLYSLMDISELETVHFQPAMLVGLDSWANDASVFAVVERSLDESYGHDVYVYRRNDVHPDGQPIPVHSPRLISSSGNLMLGTSQKGNTVVFDVSKNTAHTLPADKASFITDIDHYNFGQISMRTNAVFSSDDTYLVFADGSAYDLVSEKMVYPAGWVDPDRVDLCCTTMSPLDVEPGKPVYAASYNHNTLRWSMDGSDLRSSVNPYATEIENNQYYHIQAGQNGLVLLRLYESHQLLLFQLGSWDSIAPYVVYDTETDQWKQFPKLAPEGNVANVSIAKNQKWILQSDHLGFTRLYDFETNSFIWEKQHWFDSTAMIAVFLKNDAYILIANPSDFIYILDSATGEIVSTFSNVDFFFDGISYLYQSLEDPTENRLYLCFLTDDSAHGMVIDTNEWIPIYSVEQMAGYLSDSKSLLLEQISETSEESEEYLPLIRRPMYTLDELLVMANLVLN